MRISAEKYRIVLFICTIGLYKKNFRSLITIYIKNTHRNYIKRLIAKINIRILLTVLKCFHVTSKRQGASRTNLSKRQLNWFLEIIFCLLLPCIIDELVIRRSAPWYGNSSENQNCRALTHDTHFTYQKVLPVLSQGGKLFQQ